MPSQSVYLVHPQNRLPAFLPRCAVRDTIPLPQFGQFGVVEAGLLLCIGLKGCVRTI